MFSDYQFGHATVWRLFVVDLVAIDEADDVRVLLDVPRLSEVGKLWPLVRATLEPTVEL